MSSIKKTTVMKKAKTSGRTATTKKAKKAAKRTTTKKAVKKSAKKTTVKKPKKTSVRKTTVKKSKTSGNKTTVKKASKKIVPRKKSTKKTTKSSDKKAEPKEKKLEAAPSLPREGEMAPQVQTVDHEGRIVDFAQYVGKKNIVLYFYPKDLTPGCTVEACQFRDNYSDIQAKDALIFGVSPDSAKLHKKFIDTHQLPFPLLMDENKEICQKYGVWVEKSMYGRKYMGVLRATFLINKQGVIAKVWPKVSVKEHSQEVLEALQSL